MHRHTFQILLLALTLLLAVSCSSAELLDPPRLATQTAQKATPATATPTPMLLEVPTATAAPLQTNVPPLALPAPGETGRAITLWVNETSPAHNQALQTMATEFTEMSQIQLELIFVAPRLLPNLVTTAAISNTLPDLVLHPAEYSVGWAARGILDPDAALTAVTRLDPATFNSTALSQVGMAETGQPAAIPSDGWRQLIIYRADWFAERELAQPDNFNDLLTAAETIFEPETIVSGLVIPTDRDLVSTQQAFEYMALANGCELIDTKGEVTLIHPACLEALDFYQLLINQYSPIGIQTNTSALNAYIAGRTGIIMASPAILPALAGLDTEFEASCPVCTTDNYLAQNSGFINQLQGSGDFAAATGFSAFNMLGVTRAADTEAALAFVDYWFNDGYLQWLAVNPERKVPMRLGVNAQDRQFIEAWRRLPLAAGAPTLTDIYGVELVNGLSTSFEETKRWGFAQNQGKLVSLLYEELLLSPLLQEMLSGYFTSSQTIIEMQTAVIDLIPNYAFLPPLQETPTP